MVFPDYVEVITYPYVYVCVFVMFELVGHSDVSVELCMKKYVIYIITNKKDSRCAC